MRGAAAESSLCSPGWDVFKQHPLSAVASQAEWLKEPHRLFFSALGKY